MSKSPKFSPEVRDRAIRMVYEVRESHESQWAAIEAVASKIGCTAQTLSNWIRKASTPAAPATPAADARVKELEREVRELKRAGLALRRLEGGPACFAVEVFEGSCTDLPPQRKK